MTKSHKSKKPISPSRKIKTRMVRIDAKTIIEVDARLSDEEAIEHYFLRHTDAIRPDRHMRSRVPDVPLERSVESLTAIVQETETPEE